MLRKLSVIAAAVVIPVGVIVSGGTAEATPVVPPVDATNYTVSCSDFSGALHFKPALTSTVGPFTANVKGTVTGCSAEPVDDGTPVDIVSGKASGPLTFELNGDQGDCNVFVGSAGDPIVYPTSGTLTIAWKTAKRTPVLSSGSSLVTPTNAVHPTDGAVSLSVPGSPGGVTGSGSFSGTDGGASDSFAFDGEPFDEVFHQCFNPPGMHKLSFGGMPIKLG
jgi:hypothetical protein